LSSVKLTRKQTSVRGSATEHKTKLVAVDRKRRKQLTHACSYAIRMLLFV